MKRKKKCKELQSFLFISLVQSNFTNNALHIINTVCVQTRLHSNSKTKFQLQNLTGICERNHWLFRDQQILFCLTVLRKNIFPTVNRQNVTCQWKLQKSISQFFLPILKIDLVFSVNYNICFKTLNRCLSSMK